MQSAQCAIAAIKECSRWVGVSIHGFRGGGSVAGAVVMSSLSGWLEMLGETLTDDERTVSDTHLREHRRFAGE